MLNCSVLNTNNTKIFVLHCTFFFVLLGTYIGTAVRQPNPRNTKLDTYHDLVQLILLPNYHISIGFEHIWELSLSKFFICYETCEISIKIYVKSIAAYLHWMQYLFWLLFCIADHTRTARKRQTVIGLDKIKMYKILFLPLFLLPSNWKIES